jgi:hypothetical protein
VPTLTVNVIGSGTGTVTSAPVGISCQKSGSDTVHCSHDFTGSVTLSAVPSVYAAFGGWNTCAGTGDCLVTIDGNKTVDAAFKALRIGSDYLTLQDVYDAAQTGSTIQLLKNSTGETAGTLAANQSVTVKLSGGYDDASYGSATGRTTITGPFNISKGKIVAERIVVK